MFGGVKGVEVFEVKVKSFKVCMIVSFVNFVGYCDVFVWLFFLFILYNRRVKMF